MASKFSEDLRLGAEQLSSLADQPHLRLLRGRARRANREADRLLLGVIHSYRDGPKKLWAPVLLELLAPALVARVARLEWVVPAIDEDDLTQQLIVEVLEVAASTRLSPDTRYVQHRLLTTAGRSVTRWLQREAQRQRSLETLPNSEDEPVPDSWD